MSKANQTAAAKATRPVRKPHAAQTTSTSNSFQHAHDASENAMHGSTSPDLPGSNAATTRQVYFPPPKTSHRQSRTNPTTAVITTVTATYARVPDYPTPPPVSSTPNSLIIPVATATMTETTATIPLTPTTDENTHDATEAPPLHSPLRHQQCECDPNLSALRSHLNLTHRLGR
nr:unnamed protein product [Spirometra erinaceieuropaei]